MAFSTGSQISLLAASLALTACNYSVDVGETSGDPSDAATSGPTTTEPTTTHSSGDGGGTTSADDEGVHATMPLEPDICITPSAACDDACRANCGDPGEVCEGKLLAMDVVAAGGLDQEVAITDMLITPEGDIVVAGRYFGAPDLGLGPLPVPDTGGGLFVLRHDPEGKPIAQGSFAHDAEPWILRMMDGQLLVVTRADVDTRIYEFTAAPALEMRDIVVGRTFAVTASPVRNEMYFVGKQCDPGNGLMIGRYDGESPAVVFCTAASGGEVENYMVGVVALPSGDVVVAGTIQQDVPELGVDYPDGEASNAAFLATIEPSFEPTAMTTIKRSLLLAEAGSPAGEGVELGSLLWSGNYLIADIQAGGNITTGFDQPFEVDAGSDLLAAFSLDLEGVGVLSTGALGVYETAVDCAGNVLASVSLRSDDAAPPFGLATTKEFALAFVKIRSDAQTPLDPTPLWIVVDGGAGTSAEDQSFASAIATSADRILLGGQYRGGQVELPSQLQLPALAEPQSAPYLLELTP